MNPGDWAWCEDLRGFCRVIETQDLWGETLCRVWSPAQDTVVRVRAAQLKPLAETQLSSSPSYLTYVTAAARVADALTQNVLLAPIEASVIPLPHQIHALSRAVAHDPNPSGWGGQRIGQRTIASSPPGDGLSLLFRTGTIIALFLGRPPKDRYHNGTVANAGKSNGPLLGSIKLVAWIAS